MAVGSVLAEKYRVDRVLGAGGMGVVVAATHLELEQTVALKFLLPGACESDEVAKRFVREARAATMIRSEHVARVMDVGRLDNGSPYMVMEYLQGSDLAEVVRQGPLAIEFAAECVIQACDALAEAHAAGIIHRDLKPANLFLTQRTDGSPLVKVLDFGISKLTVPSATDANLTRTSAVMGSPYYMSPEQMKSTRAVDHRTDIWSLGVILFELIGGRTPFAGATLPELIAAIMTDPPGELRTLRPDVPAPLEAAILRCLEKDSSRRFNNVAEFVHALIPFAPAHTRGTADRVSRVLALATSPNLGVASTEAAVPAASGLAHGTATSWTETGQVSRTESRRSNKAVVVGLLAAGSVVLAGAGVAVYTLLGRHDPAGSEAAVPSGTPEAEARNMPAPAVSSSRPLPEPTEAAATDTATPAVSVTPSEPASTPPKTEPRADRRSARRPSDAKGPAAPPAATASPPPAASPLPTPSPPPPVRPPPKGNPLDVGLK